jgi:bacteriorhodopsin
MDMQNHNNKSYYYLVAMAMLSFVCMYILMYAMVDRFVNVYYSLNQFYMAGLMTVPMIIIEMLLMRAMYGNKRWNIAIIVLSVFALIIFWIFIRQQFLIGDKQFLKSMIPHHAGAILMCEKATLQNFEVKKLCENIKVSQQNEINQMKDILKTLEH